MEKIVVIGTDKEAESFLYKNRGKYEVVLFVDNRPRRNSFRGVSVITLDSIVSMCKDIKHKIIIATKEDEYIEIARKLNQYGLEEFRDYFYFEVLEKKLAFFWGNCYIGDLSKFMKQFPSFDEEFWIYPLTNVHSYDRFYFSRRFFSRVRLFMYQEISSQTNGKLYSSDGILELIPEAAVKIKIPNLYRKGFCFFPQSFCRGHEIMRECERKFVVYMDNHDSVITQKKSELFSDEQIAAYINNGNVFEKEKIIYDFEMMIKDIQEMEFHCDVKIAAWIKNHYKEEIIFIDPGHVSEAVFAEYISQILKILGLYEAEKDNIRIVCSQPAVLRMPVYGCVRDALQLKWVDNANCSIKKDSWSLYRGGVCLDVLEYVRQYSYICVESHTI